MPSPSSGLVGGEAQCGKCEGMREDVCSACCLVLLQPLVLFSLFNEQLREAN